MIVSPVAREAPPPQTMKWFLASQKIMKSVMYMYMTYRIPPPSHHFPVFLLPSLHNVVIIKGSPVFVITVVRPRHLRRGTHKLQRNLSELLQCTGLDKWLGTDSVTLRSLYLAWPWRRAARAMPAPSQVRKTHATICTCPCEFQLFTFKMLRGLLTHACAGGLNLAQGAYG